MTVFNKTSKIIGVGGTPVLPMAFAAAPDSFLGNPILRRMADEGRIVINPSDGAARTAPETPPADPPPVPEPAPAPVPEPAAEAPASEAQEPETTGEAAPKADDAPPAESPRKKAAKA